jgi:hypothetical protein
VEETRNAYRILEEKPVGGLRRKWWIDIKMDHREMNCEGEEVDRTGSGSCSVVGFVISGDNIFNSTTRELISHFV